MVSDPLYYRSVITGNSKLRGQWHTAKIPPLSCSSQKGLCQRGVLQAWVGRIFTHPALYLQHRLLTQDTSSHRKLFPNQALFDTSIFSWSVSAGTVPSASEHFLSLLWVKEIVHLTPFLFHPVLFSPLPSSQLPTMDRRQEDWLQVTYITIPYVVPKKDTFLPDTVEGCLPPCLLSVHLGLTHLHTRVALSNPLNLMCIIPR